MTLQPMASRTGGDRTRAERLAGEGQRVRVEVLAPCAQPARRQRLQVRRILPDDGKHNVPHALAEARVARVARVAVVAIFGRPASTEAIDDPPVLVLHDDLAGGRRRTHAAAGAHIGAVGARISGWRKTDQLADLGFGRIVVSELEVPNMLVNLV